MVFFEAVVGKIKRQIEDRIRILQYRILVLHFNRTEEIVVDTSCPVGRGHASDEVILGGFRIN
jgi:hypothetical protein